MGNPKTRFQLDLSALKIPEKEKWLAKIYIPAKKIHHPGLSVMKIQENANPKNGFPRFSFQQRWFTIQVIQL
jgi:hypothetical protein